MVAIHDAWRRSQAQLRVLDDKVESGGGAAGSLPWEEVRDWYQAEGNYIDILDRAAESLVDTLDGPRGIEGRLRTRHHVKIEEARNDDTRLSRFAADRPSAAARGAGVRGGDAGGERGQRPRLSRGARIAVARPRQLCRRRAADAVSPLSRRGSRGTPRHRPAAPTLRHSFEQTCHRLSTLQRPGAQGIPFFFCRVDMAGNITKRHSATRLEFARFGGACPLWVVHEAVAIPDRILVQLAETPDGARYVSMAKGLAARRRTPPTSSMPTACVPAASPRRSAPAAASARARIATSAPFRRRRARSASIRMSARQCPMNSSDALDATRSSRHNHALDRKGVCE
ncbi:putative transcriptional regulator (DUF2083) domain-containing protein [Ditylenchus destructor]|uniref:Transcriptional regulator (DUF2083) domain-containing protein n=1 Tax=Ditylenchus destructor TaxID=166010 RepID=A0AAD4QW43_9BILA|nr:putative transcriptional regulator (DUF2083) domain-containing protein [Ditylenchus destructor]